MNKNLKKPNKINSKLEVENYTKKFDFLLFCIILMFHTFEGDSECLENYLCYRLF